MPRLFPIALALTAGFGAVAVPTIASAQAEGGLPPQRIRNVTLTGGEKCPEAQGDEIVVCNRINPAEQYRIPKELRGTQEVAPQNQAWNNRVTVADQVGREAAGLPDTCSPVGTGGQSGCALKLNQAYAAQKRAATTNDPGQP